MLRCDRIHCCTHLAQLSLDLPQMSQTTHGQLLHHPRYLDDRVIQLIRDDVTVFRRR